MSFGSSSSVGAAAGPLNYEYETNINFASKPCPGFYCGRTPFENGSFSSCGPCPRGYQRRVDNYACHPCEGDLQFYDWLYLGFMAILPILFHFSSIDEKRAKSNTEIVSLGICAVLEIVAAAAITLLVFEPFGTLGVTSCGVTSLSDWYPIFYNPNPNYEETIFCSFEVVYPLYTIVLVFYALADLLMILMRFVVRLFGVKVAKSIYAGLYFYPLLALVHLILAGIIYSIFPFITVIGSIISMAYHFAKRPNQDVKTLFLESIQDWKNLFIILFHWFLHAYGILSITLLNDIRRDLSLIALIPAPALLYILTVNFTDPSKRCRQKRERCQTEQ